MRGTVRKKQLAADMEGAAQHRRRLALKAGPSSNPGQEVSSYDQHRGRIKKSLARKIVECQNVYCIQAIK